MKAAGPIVDCKEAPPLLLSSRLVEWLWGEAGESKYQQRPVAQVKLRGSQTGGGALTSGTGSTSEAPSGTVWSQGSIDTFEKLSSIHKPWPSMFWLWPPDGEPVPILRWSRHRVWKHVQSLTALLPSLELSWDLELSLSRDKTAAGEQLFVGGKEGGGRIGNYRTLTLCQTHRYMHI